MDVFSALQTAVSGLKAQSFALDNISGNIANSATTAYKRTDTSFSDLVTEFDNPKRQVAGSVAADSRKTTSVQGLISATDTATNMALNGDGFFVVQTKTGMSGSTSTFSGDVYTRRGDFALDKNGYLVNGGGAYLTGSTLDPASGNVTATGSPIQISSATLPAKATSTITYSAILPKTPATGNTSSSLLPAFSDGTDARVLSGTGTGTVTTANASTFVNDSITGPTLTVYSAGGDATTIQTRWAKVANASASAGTSDTWNLFYANNNTSTGTDTSWTNVGQAFTFNSSGQLSAPTGGSVPLSNVTIGGTALGNLTLKLGSGGLTQQASSAGTAITNALSQDGYSAGTLKSLSVTENGTIQGTYTNGRTLSLATAATARFANADGLVADSSGTYAQTADSGEPLSGLGATTIVGSNVEASNTDIASEFSKMIVTQQAYSANTRVMSTAQNMMSDLLNVIR
ncbi:flagellar hook-basal body complex protein [Methylobacterium organophilum]|uniref:flagellar hook protein FlgE n=1 Tax=Methylobacterium organophilum TaxID=410 RepID=UPI001F140DBB|nr:flagellar hook-basal body complex protein [Methylobacterium organophilum]UMY19073.1 flagellar hook-basal body complex protein [Methylobacterium organophilum]